MQRIDELDLYHLDWDTPEFAADPYSEFDKAREKHPWLAKTDAGYAVFGLQAIRDLLGNDGNLRPSFDGIAEIMECKGSPWGRFCEEQMIALPEREHKLLRETFAAKFTPRYANQLRPIMRETMERLLKDWAPREKIDFEEFASYYPVAVTAQMVGAPLDVIPGLRKSMETLGLAFALDKTAVPELDKAFLHMDAFAQDLVAERRANPHEGDEQDLLDIILEAADQGEISDRQLYDLLIFLFVAGYDTSKNMITLIMWLLMERPEMYKRCGEDHDYARKAVEEAFRIHSTTSNQRILNEDIVYRDVLLEKGSIVWFTLSVATHDPRYAEDYETFDPERKQVNKHVGFGLGPHICLGQYIARAQIHEGIHEICKRLKNPRTAGPQGFRPFPGTWGIRGLPIEFDLAEEEVAA